MKVTDMMMPLRQYFKPDHTLKEAAEILRAAIQEEEKIGVKGLPVLDRSGNMVGFLSMGWDG